LNRFGYNESTLVNWIGNTSVDESDFRTEVNKFGYFFLSKRDALCLNGICSLFDRNRVPFTYDKHHLSYEFAIRLALNNAAEISQYLGFSDITGNKLGVRFPAINSDNLDLVVKSWGPNFTDLGVIPNIQPDGGIGLWIEVSDTQGLGNLEVLIGGQKASKTFVQAALITASIPPEIVKNPGKHDVSIRQIGTNKLFSVGVFEIHSAR
jgi:hypothetical protein